MINKKEFASIESDILFVEYIEVKKGEDFEGKYVKGADNSDEWAEWQDCKIKLRVEDYSFSIRYLMVQYDEYTIEEDLYVIPERDEFKSVIKYERGGKMHEYERIVWKEDELMSRKVMYNANPSLVEKLEELGKVIFDEGSCCELFGEFYEIDYPYFYQVERKISFQEIEDAFNL